MNSILSAWCEILPDVRSHSGSSEPGKPRAFTSASSAPLLYQMLWYTHQAPLYQLGVVQHGSVVAIVLEMDCRLDDVDYIFTRTCIGLWWIRLGIDRKQYL